MGGWEDLFPGAEDVFREGLQGIKLYFGKELPARPPGGQ